MKMSAIRSLQAKLADACADIDKQIEELMQRRKEIASPIEDKIAYEEEQLKKTALGYSHSYKGELGEIKYRKGYERKSWDTKKLEGYAADHPEIMHFQKITQVSPNVSIKIY
jgi:hypothetical protein